MSSSLLTIGFFAIFGGWAFLSLLGTERQRRLYEIEAERAERAKAEAPPATPPNLSH